MGLFVRDDDYDESVRMTGFNRYKQLLSFYAGHWFLLGLICFVAAIPLILVVSFSILSNSLLILLIGSFLAGGIVGPFFACLIDSIMRGLRDDTTMQWIAYKRAFKQNFITSLLPGAFLGLGIGIYSFLVHLITAQIIPSPTKGFYIILCIAAFLFLQFENLFWPQFVLFEQPLLQTLRNSLLFTSKYLWKAIFVVIIEFFYIILLTLFAPISMILLPFLGIWYPAFLLQYHFYEALNEELKIEEKFKEKA